MGKKVYDCPLFFEHTDRAAQYTLIYERINQFWVRFGRPQLNFESPAEAVFWVWFNAVQWSDNSILFTLKCQEWITDTSGERFRLDFRVYAADKALPLAVEIDGHEWHEKTRDQVTKRNQRDRVLQSLGIRVFHFSFQELNDHPATCATEVAEAAQGCLLDQPVEAVL